MLSLQDPREAKLSSEGSAGEHGIRPGEFIMRFGIPVLFILYTKQLRSTDSTVAAASALAVLPTFPSFLGVSYL